jgi:signal transduction histidine kinase/CheY-like chemotaxis protein
VPVAGRNWLVVVKGLPISGTLPVIAEGLLLIGLALSLMLFAITRAQVVGWEKSARHAAELRTSEEALRRSESELRRMVALEREARTQAEAADRTKDEFLAILSHELRTPLNAVLGWLSMLRNGAVAETRRDGVLEVIERNARVQAQLIEDLLDVSRIIMGKVRLELAPVSFAPVVSTVLDSIRPSAEAKGVSLHVAFSVTTETIRADAGRLQQIISNLLFNAIKFTPPSGHVFVEATRENNQVQLSVRDTGLGIEPEFLPHIFERFRQADSSVTRTHSGIGLGLAIVQHLVHLHGGTVEAQSEGPNRGALFIVRFPLVAAKATVRVTKPPLQSPRLAGVRVLVVDDDRDTRELLTEALGESGARVTSADSAKRALEVLIEDGADVLVSDIGMPGEDGLSLMRRIRLLPGDRGRIPAIALTAYARAEDRLQAIDAGYQMHMTKPVALRELQAGLAKLAAEQHHDVATT